MIAQYIKIGTGWNVLVYYSVHEEDFLEVEDALKQLGCSRKTIKKSLKVLTRKNTGFTFSNSEYKMSIVCIGPSSDVS